MDLNGNRIIAVDFDGTLSLDAEWPEIGRANIDLITSLKVQQASGARLILWTCRNGKDLDAAVAWCKKYGLEFDTVNENLPEMIEAYGGDTRKINADIYIDDKAVQPPRPVFYGSVLSNCLKRGFRDESNYEISGQ